MLTLSRSGATSVPHIGLFWFHQLAGNEVCLRRHGGRGRCQERGWHELRAGEGRGVKMEHYLRNRMLETLSKALGVYGRP